MSSSKALPDEHFTFLSVQQALSGPANGFCRAISGHWWSVHPEKGLRFYTGASARRRTFVSPQCNLDKRIVERLCYHGDELMYLERVWVPVDLNDYMDR